ncbi:FIMAH domain-containing protein [Actinoplanes sp. CA-252034]|uniref:FIMAH domain-containing protein n=1 Tax=Actinoplanes sp. CA-252034 TaxID=3239906 RepID=UPI003D96C9EE
MPEPHDLQQPTAQLPVVEPRGVYRAANHRRTALIAAGAAAAVLLLLVVWLFSGDDEPAPVAAAPAPSTTTASAEAQPEATGTAGEPEPSATTTATPTATPTTAPATRPAQPVELITGLASVIGVLEDEGELDDDGAEALTRRLEQATQRLSRGDARGALRKIDEFRRKLRDLREDDDLSGDGFSLLNQGAEQIRAALRRG